MSGPRRRRLFPRTLNECAQPLMKPALEKHGALQAQLLRDWAHVVGAELSAHVSPGPVSWPKGKNAEGTLTLRVAGGFALEVQHLEPFILEKIAAYLGYRAIVKLRIQQVARREPAAAPPRPSGPAPTLAAEVGDEALRTSLQRLALALQARRG